MLFWYFNKCSREELRHNITRMDAAQQDVRYSNTVTLGNVCTVINLGDLVTCVEPKILFPFPFELLPRLLEI